MLDVGSIGTQLKFLLLLRVCVAILGWNFKAMVMRHFKEEQ